MLKSLQLITFILFIHNTEPLLSKKNDEFRREICADSRDRFANYSAQFILCAVENARPIKLCEKCIDVYMNVVESYSNMSKVTFNGTSCLDVFVHQDRLEIVESMLQNTLDLWSKGKCYDCYVHRYKLLTKDLSNQTQKFIELHENFENCVKTISPSDQLCTKCLRDYNTLNNYFITISDVNEDISCCIDIVDMMNDTWTYWSSECCKYRRHNEYIFIGISCAVGLLTITFYIILHFCEEKKAPMIIQQTRFAESINSFRTEVGQISQ